MNIFRFLDWQMYKDAKKLNLKLTKLSNCFNLDVKIKYGRQLGRATLSVCLNMAEGAGRFTDIEMCRFFDIALGSLAEVMACTDLLRDENHINNISYKDIKSDVLSISKQIQGMQYSIKKNPIQKRNNV